MTTRTYVDTFAQGEVVSLQIDTTPNGSGTYRVTVSDEIAQPEPEPPAETLRVGMEGATGAPTATILETYRPHYMRDFGTKYNGETLPSLTRETDGKLAMMPDACLGHLSWKTDVNRLAAYLPTMTRKRYLTWYHEPMGDVAPATYRATAAKIAPQIAASGKADLVLGHGPIVTRYWLDEGNGDPLDWWYDGATFYGIDWYEPSTTYKGAPALARALDKVRAALPGVRILIPEYGLLIGAGRADAIRRDMDYFRAQPDVDAVAYWNSYVTGRDYRISAGSPEASEWQRQCTLSA